jgi:hypothetical protein
MGLIVAVLFCLPVIFLITMFIGIVKKNKRLWITSLIFLVVISIAEGLYFNTVQINKSNGTVQKTNSKD